MLRMAIVATLLGIFGTAVMGSSVEAQVSPKSTTVVLVHGAFADSSSWNPVIAQLTRNGYMVIAVANPLRGLAADADYVARTVASVDGPVVLVGHSYGGGVISMAAVGAENVTGLVFVAGFAPDEGESAASLSALYPTGTLGETLAPPVPLANGAHDLYILQSKFWLQFAADVPETAAIEMAVAQRPIAQAALGEPAGTAAWRTLPSWFIWGSSDKNIPGTLHAFLADRANAREAVEIEGASHVVMLSHPDKVASLIERAAGPQ